MYETLAPAGTKAAFLSQVNAEGAKGFRFISGLVFGTAAVDAFVKDVDTTYVVEARDMVASRTDLENQLNAQGAQGFRWAGPYSAGSDFFEMYRKDQGASTTYSYSVVAARASAADFLAEANSLGASGYYLTGPGYMAGSESVTIYEKASTGAVYAYELLEQPGTADEFLAQLNAQGARGLRFRTAFVFSEGTRLLYEKDTTQAAQFVFYGLAPAGSSADFVAQANAEGQKGGALVGDYVLPGGAARTLYVTPSACSGLLCLTRGPFGG